mmetsp:Transcript_33877/g.79211  ORF Transcript_33877/g.79211 Transcript_33877/m.79211 type:complete len:363 (+) Transcript_33877:172-1260(+)|eukprot:CAMPEP_0178409210 /NCGR_PEP_ID=MMETSP0689_2-20121128/20346_1 /TAXON_ID=160604 /ORGANISM="Amphidinium massartii, Strain CS-259" /LENGTH=362 /DNA_ID=CAMNT_0020030347 /DNA_START=172 /DNA_END=1260 /DNA_ORIENTATION=-
MQQRAGVVTWACALVLVLDHAAALRPKDLSEDGVVDVAHSNLKDMSLEKCYENLHMYLLTNSLEGKAFVSALHAMDLFVDLFVRPANKDISQRDDKEMVFALAVQAILEHYQKMTEALNTAIKRKGAARHSDKMSDDGEPADWVDGVGSTAVLDMGEALSTVTNSKLKGGHGTLAMASWLLTLLQDDFAKWIDVGDTGEEDGRYFRPAVVSVVAPGLMPDKLSGFLSHMGFKVKSGQHNDMDLVQALWKNSYSTLMSITDEMTQVLRTSGMAHSVKRRTPQSLWELCQGQWEAGEILFPTVEAMEQGKDFEFFNHFKASAKEDASELITYKQAVEDSDDLVDEKPQLKDYVAWLDEAPFVEG